jgi:polar amino acid transport system substrate-binding protein
MKKLFICLVFTHFLKLISADLRVGMELSYPPFEMVCQDGRACGISVDIAKAFGKYLEKDTQIENISFVGLIPSLKNGNIDLIISSLTITKERQKAIDFSDYYVRTGLCLLLKIDSEINNIEEANKKENVIVVKSGTSGELYAKQHLQIATVRVLEKEAMCVLEVVQGKADAFIYDQLSIYTNWQKNLTTTKANLEPFKIEYWAFGIRKNNEVLVQKANQFIKTFRENGGFDSLADKYLAEEKQAFKQMGVPFVF